MAQLYKNNMVFIWVSKEVSDTDGNTLGTDYESYYTTTYDPMYTSVRRVRLDLGTLVSTVPDDTINLAIFEASLEVDALTFGTITFSTASELRFYNFAKRMYATCAAEQILLDAIFNDAQGGKSKELADLRVNYQNTKEFSSLLEKALNCKTKFEAILTSGGSLGPGTSQKPSYVVRGALEPDRPTFGRDWESSAWWNGTEEQIPAANCRTIGLYNRRWKRNFRSARWGSRYETD